jgi:hypothetical protein
MLLQNNIPDWKDNQNKQPSLLVHFLSETFHQLIYQQENKKEKLNKKTLSFKAFSVFFFVVKLKNAQINFQ